MPKTLCKIKKLLTHDMHSYVVHVKKPKYICKTCGRVAKKKGLLCAPVNIKKV